MKEFYNYILKANTPSPVFPDRFYRLTDGAVLGMRFYPPEIINPEKGFSETTAISISDSSNFINPQKNNIIAIDSSSQNLISTCESHSGVSILIDQMKETTSNIKLKALKEFDRHTDRLTGQIAIGTELPIDVDPSETRLVPYLLPLDSIGKNYSYFKYVETGEIDETIMLNSYSSISLNISSYAETINSMCIQISSNVVPNEIEPFQPPYLFVMDTEYAANLQNTLDEIYSTLTNSRRSDEAAYANLIEAFNVDKTGNNIMLLISDIQKEMIDYFQSNVNI